MAHPTAIDNKKFDVIAKKYEVRTDIVEIHPEEGWVQSNRVKFSHWIKKTFKYSGSKVATDPLFPSQRFVKDFMQYDSPYRGILLYHGLGLGKTKASIVVGETLMNHYEKVVIMVPASLKTNYIEELKNRGSNSFFTVNQHWKFYSKRQMQDGDTGKVAAENLQAMADKLFTNMATIRKNDGLWIPLKDATPNWDQLSDKEKAQVNLQLDSMISSKYDFVKYNGIQKKKANAILENALKGDNIYDNKVIIVDEVHNFVSRSLKEDSVCKQLYKAMYLAKNCKLVLLTGTPLINYPYELAFVVNLLKGPQWVYTLTPKKFDKEYLQNFFDSNPYVDHYELAFDKKQVSFQLLPQGFTFSKKSQKFVARDRDSTSQDDVLKTIVSAVPIQENEIGKPKDHMMLPMSRDEFFDRFIDIDKNLIKNEYVLKRRMMGCISYFGTYFGDLYPELMPTEIIDVEMSDHQFKTYLKKRTDEIKAEERNKKVQRKRVTGNNNNDMYDKKTQTYRSFTRAICDFVFPEGISRPYPSSSRGMKIEMDTTAEVGDEEELEQEKEQEGGADKEADAKYKKAIKLAMSQLSRGGKTHLLGDALKSCSPKYHKLVELVNDPKNIGKILVYSQFRMVEGLGVLSLILTANGWVEFAIKKIEDRWTIDFKGLSPEEWKKRPKFFQFFTGTDDTKMLMKIYNNNFSDIPQSIKEHCGTANLRGEVLKLMMITQSGAEGISLKHVRQVHVIEPYWNEIRIEQVIGRAVRANSHKELPKEEKNVCVYRYIISFAKNQKMETTIKNKDLGKTTDEFIYDLASRKAKVIGRLQQLMQEAAVDCLVHEHSHSKDCVRFPANVDPTSLAYVWEYAKEEQDDVFKQKLIKNKKKWTDKFRSCEINGVKYAVNMDTHVLYDMEGFKDGILIERGHIEKTQVGKMRIVWNV